MKKAQNKKNNIISEKYKIWLKKFYKSFRYGMFRILVGITEIVIFLLLICCFVNWSNDSLIITNSVYEDNKLPSSFKGYCILQISDFNNKSTLSKKLIKETERINPDIIVITGDYVNSDRCTEYNVDYSYLETVVQKYPVYFISGEQEKDIIFYEKMKNKLETMGIIVLDNNSIELKNKTDVITLMGVADSSFFYENVSALNETIKNMKTENYTILLSHRPELIDVYTSNNIDFVISGHALGGQLRLPFIGPLYSSNQGFYPNYTSGFYKQENTTVYVSRGIGNTFIPIRLFNRPEINVITLK